MRVVLLSFLCICCIYCFSGVSQSDTWVAYEIPEFQRGDLPPMYWNFYYTFENDRLSLFPDSGEIGLDSGARNFDLLHEGNWAVMGTIDAAGNLAADAFAIFVVDGIGAGHVEWADNTPVGYTAPLLLGYSFIGDEAVSYQAYHDYEPDGPSVVGTLVIWEYPPRLVPVSTGTYTSLSHIFYATYAPVPEPSSILALIAGIGVISGLWLRRRQVRA